MCSSETITTAAPTYPERPYVGLRPYRSDEKAIFHGRDRDARLLTDKIFSARLTLLYSQSGFGKSSLLHSLVIPKLEDEQARTVFFDDWAGEEPLTVLKVQLLHMAEELGISDAAAGAPTITELVRLISSQDDYTLVLVLDQFDEFLFTHGQDLDPVRMEIAELVHATGLDVCILISLRQEFLAALEPFRSQIMNLFESTYHLQALDEEGVQEAIVEPALLFGVSYQPELVKTLIRDLHELDLVLAEKGYTRRFQRTKHKAIKLRTIGQIDLPMLQLVCDQLWDARGDESTLSLGHYKKLGGALKILERYVRGVMPKKPWAKKFTARLMRYLAPPSGLKISYSVDDLAVVAELDRGAFKTLNKERVQAELKRLAKADILRSRQFRGEERFSLRHDAFIKIIAPWRDQVLARFRRWRNLAWIASSFAISILLVVNIKNYIEIKEFERRTESGLVELQNMDPTKKTKELVKSRFDSAASYMLLEQGGEARFDQLRDLLIRHKEQLPVWYGIEQSGIEHIQFPNDDWPLTVRYSSQRQLDGWYFNLTWQEMAKSLVEVWGIPVPKRVRLIPDPTFPAAMLKLEGPEINSLAAMLNLEGPEINSLLLEVPLHENHAFITEKDLSGPTKEFFDYFRHEEWILIDSDATNGPWWVVPRWSLPVWKISGQTATDGSGLPAFLLALELQKNPRLLLPQGAVDLLLERVAATYPQTVAEARAARGDRLRQDLIARLRQGYELDGLRELLDALTHYPDEESELVAKMVAEDLTSSAGSIPEKFHGPWETTDVKKMDTRISKAAEVGVSEAGTGGMISPPKIDKAYREVEAWLPPVEPPIRVYLGQGIESAWTTKQGSLISHFSERIEATRDEIFQRFGIELPGVRFRPQEFDQALPEMAFRIEVLNQNRSNSDAEPILTEPETTLDRLIDEITFRAEDFRTYWLSAEHVHRAIETMESGLRDWLFRHYSLTDLKLLQRAVIEPTIDELDYSAEIPQEHTLRHLDWLLGSLVFWAQIDEHLDTGAVTMRLRETQRARLEPRTATTTNRAVNDIVGGGIKKLIAGDVQEAEAEFSRAIEVSQEQAINSFLAFYPQELNQLLTNNLDKACEQPTLADLSRNERINLKELLEKTERGQEVKQRQRLTLCLLASYPIRWHIQSRELMTKLSADYSDPKQWPPKQAAWLAQQIFNEFSPLLDGPTMHESGETFIKSAISRLSDKDSSDAFWKVVQLCYKPGPNNWCWSLLNELVELRPETEIPFLLAWTLSGSERREDLDKALKWAEKAENNIHASKLEPRNRDVQLEYVQLTRAQTLDSLAALGDEHHLAEAEAIYKSLLGSPSVGELAHQGLAGLLLDQGRLDESEEIVKKSLEKWPSNANFHLHKIFIQLFRGDIEKATDTTNDVLRQAGKTSEALLVSALGQILTGIGQWEHRSREFLATDHEYVPYVAMMLYANMAGDAKEAARQLLDERWAEIAPNQESWGQRLSGGDITAWREKLIGYYKGVVKDKDIFPLLEDEVAFAQSDFRHLPLPRRSLLCEAYFYDAMLAMALGDLNGRLRMRSRLKDVIKTDCRRYHEYKMAKFLLENEDRNSPQ